MDYGVIHDTQITFLNGYIGSHYWFSCRRIFIVDLSCVLFLYYVTGIPFSEKQAIKVKIILIINKELQCLFREEIGAHMDFIVHQSLKIVEWFQIMQLEPQFVL